MRRSRIAGRMDHACRRFIGARPDRAARPPLFPLFADPLKMLRKKARSDVAPGVLANYAHINHHKEFG